MNTQTAISTTFSEEKKTPMIYKILVILAMMSLMGGTITGVMTYINLGYSETFFNDWLHSFLVALVTVMPCGFFIMAGLTKLAAMFLTRLKESYRNVLVGIATALIMESGMAFTTTINNIGLSNTSEFLSAWLQGILGALPVALALMITINLTIKPKVERFLKS